LIVNIYNSPSLHGTTSPLGPGPPECRGFIICYPHYTRYNSSGQVISPAQRPLPNTQHLQETDIDAPGGIKTHTLDHAATGIGTECKYDVHEQIILINENIHKKYKPMHIKFSLLIYQLTWSKHVQRHNLYCI